MFTCRVYKICNLEDKKEYVGSTKQKLNRRMTSHEVETRKNRNNMPLHDHMRELGIRKFYIELLEEKEVANRRDQRILESEWQDKLKPELNKVRAYSSKEKKLELAKIHYNENKEEVLGKKKAKRLKDIEDGTWKCDCCQKSYTSSSALNAHLNKDDPNVIERRLAKDKTYRENNRDTINQRAKKYKARNKDKISTYNKEYTTKNNPPIQCECGKTVTTLKMKRHKLSKYHASRMV